MFKNLLRIATLVAGLAVMPGLIADAQQKSCSAASFSKALSVFSDSTAFSVAEVDGLSVLLLSEETFSEDAEASRSAIAAQVLLMDAEGKLRCLGEVRSQGTAYPVAIGGDCIMVAGHHFVRKYSAGSDGLRLIGSVDVSYSRKGKPTCVYEDRLRGEYRTSSNEDDYSMMFKEYEAAMPVSFLYVCDKKY